MTLRSTLWAIALLTSLPATAMSQIRPPNYDESLVPQFSLPHVLEGPDGKQIERSDDWPKQRNYLLNLLATHEYGFAPSETVERKLEKIDDGNYTNSHGVDGSIRRRQYAVTLARNGRSVRVDLLVWSPADAKPVGCFLGLNFRGNQSTSDDPNVRITTSWCDARHPGVVDHRATEASRANQEERWPIRDIVGSGYAVATAHYCDIDPDYDDGFENGVHALFPEFRCSNEHPERWGTIATWAWGLSRLADALAQIDGIDPERLMVVGHSRLGKTALWAGANDTRFRLVVSNNSGCGGAALSKRCYGESVAAINRSFPHWFNRNFRVYNDAEETMPFDQHQLIAAIAPRPVYIASASLDRWADPLGELLSGYYAAPAYELFHKEGLTATKLPQVNRSIGGSIGYHLREGEHDLLPFDWKQFVAFASKHGL
ncbi:MAG: alpha/beta hydrolase family protein [Planctomycetota bacterium]|jgi:hypothetical protein